MDDTREPDGSVGPAVADGRRPVCQVEDIVNWRESAACRFEDPELFFPVSEDGASLPQIERARRICHSCPVEHECRTWAVRRGEADGVWGGLTARQRKSLSPARTSAQRSRAAGEAE